MANWFPSTTSTEGAREALKQGSFGSLAFAASVGLGLIWFLIAGSFPGQPQESRQDNIYSTIGIVLELSLALWCAYRFQIKKGYILGVVTLIVWITEVVMKIVDAMAKGKPNIGWWFFYFAVGAALVNGVRGAWAIKRSRFIEPQSNAA